MKIVARQALMGPNRYARYPVIRLEVDLEGLEYRNTSTLFGFTSGLLRAVPSLAEHGCCFGESGGFVRRLEEGTWMGHVLEHVALALQNLVHQDVAFGKTRGTGELGHYDVVFACRDREIGMLAADAAHAIIEALLPERLRSSRGSPEAPEAIVGRFLREAGVFVFGPSTGALVRAAEARGVPWRRLGNGSLLQLGYGRHAQRLWGTVTGQTSSVAVDIACDKAQTHAILQSLGLPVPLQRRGKDLRSVHAAAEALGWPLVFKPMHGNHGRGITVVFDGEDLERGFARARAFGDEVLIEQFVTGSDHRMLVVGGRLVAAAMRVPGHVVGDGERTIEALVERANADPRRGEGHANLLTRLSIDDEARRLLEREGLDSSDIPSPGQFVLLRETANLSTGGTSVDVTDRVHPDNRRIAERAARAVGLDVAGIDFLCPDISRSALEVGGAICEVNASPGLRMHLAPSQGRPRDVAGPILDLLFPAQTPVAPPIVAITGTNGKTTTARMLAHICAQIHETVGLTTTDGVYIGGERVFVGDMTGPMGAGMVLEDPQVDVAVLEVARGGLLRAGMGVAYCDVGAVLNVSADHLGLGGVHDEDEMAFIKSVVVEVARDTAVLNADDPRVRAMASRCRARHICYISERGHDPFVRERIAAGDRAVTLEPMSGDALIVAYDHRSAIPIVPVASIPATLNGLARHNVFNAMAATGMALALGIPLAAIRRALSTFHCDYATTPGRMNVYDGHPFRVIVDYAHNANSFECIGDMVSAMPVVGRKIGVLGMAGDRRDEDIMAAARTVAPYFDLFVCRCDPDLRGRSPGEIPRLLQHGLRMAGVRPEAITVALEELEGVRVALEGARPGDLVLLFSADVERTWERVVGFQSAFGAASPAETG
jgi:cyanophycin synthetase